MKQSTTFAFDDKFAIKASTDQARDDFFITI